MTAVLREPLEVEFAHAGGWHRGVLLGWHEDASGTCSMRLRCVLGGLRHTTWLPLTHLRLPEPTRSLPRPRSAAAGRVVAPA